MKDIKEKYKLLIEALELLAEEDDNLSIKDITEIGDHLKCIDSIINKKPTLTLIK